MRPAPRQRRAGRPRRSAALLAAAVLLPLLPAAAGASAEELPPPPSDAELAAAPERHDLSREQFYFVLPDRFANGDTGNDTGGITGGRLDHGFDPTNEGFYHGGDLRGLIDRLDYIEDLGTTAIWMAPVFTNRPVQGAGESASAGYHGYWITDFTTVDPHFGTNAELAELVDEAHARGMKVFFDVITNHTADVLTNAEGTGAYRPEGAYPYVDASGVPFDDTDYAGTGTFPEVNTDSFAYTPVLRDGADATAKSPAWLNDPTMYHNRGDSTFVGESAESGEHSGLDDLWTERPEVVQGMIDIYSTWVEEVGIDGFRIDTVKHVDMDFWKQWAPAVAENAAELGHDDFFMFGEVHDPNASFTSRYVTEGGLQAALDFPFAYAAREYVSQGGSARALGEMFAEDYWYTSADSNAYSSPTFLGNHDMGRFGSFLLQDNPGATQDELLARDRLGHELLFLSRGQPVVYYGDEQGMTGSGGDKAARHDLFASATPIYNDDPVLGGESGSRDNYDTDSPMYLTISELSELTAAHPALRDGTQTERYADDGAGVYAFSRTDAEERVEYLVAVNNAEQPRTAELPTFSAGMTFDRLYPAGGTAPASLTSAADATVTVEVPALSAVVYRAAAPLAEPADAPALTLTTPADGASGTVTLEAEVTGGDLNRVTFAAAVGEDDWQVLGTADAAPHRVTQNLSGVPAGTTVRYKAVVEDSAGNLASTTGQTVLGAEPPEPDPVAVQRDHAVVHYVREDGDYDDWNLYAWGDIADGAATEYPDGAPFVGRDAYGAFAWVPLKPGASEIGFLVVDDQGNKDVSADRTIDVTATGEVWIREGQQEVLTEPPIEQPDPPADTAVLHYHREDGDYTGWGLHTWTGSANPTDWNAPLQPVSQDAYGVTFEVPLLPGATTLNYIVHKGDEKDLPSDRSLDLAAVGREVWLLAGREGQLLPQAGGTGAALDVTTAYAQWIDAGTVVWDADLPPAGTAQLRTAPDGGIAVADGRLTGTDGATTIRLQPVEGGLTEEQRARFPHLADRPAYTLDPRDADRAGAALLGQTVATMTAPNGAVAAATGVQIAGVLDDLYAEEAVRESLGLTWGRGNKPTLAVWAPTARSVSLELYGKRPRDGAEPEVVAMTRDEATGVWSVTGKPSWKGQHYRYRVEVWAPEAQAVVVNSVTDPYAVALSADSGYAIVANLDDRDTKPRGWDDHRDGDEASATAPELQQIQELHVRDFSVADTTVPEADRGTYRAFTHEDSAGMRHLRELAEAGVTTVHLLPVYDFASAPERRADQALPDCDLAALPADSAEQQECVMAVAAEDAFNWGYDPFHYNVPEGSYASSPDGTTRTREFREMVQALHDAGLEVVLDVVYNHTFAAGQDERSVLDRIVPGYYHRLNDDGSVTANSCCPDTAPEHAMMNKLVVDSVVGWARDYQVDGFRFDLMGLMPKQTMVDVRAALDQLTLEEDGVDGESLFLYGEGWNFGVVADDARFEQATQINMAGTGIATFNDRLRDAVRGGSPFDADPGVQGFASGLYTDPNASTANGTEAEQRARLLHYQDLIKVGLTGNLAGYRFTDTSGRETTGAEVDYNGAPAGYTAAPGEAITYVDAHDNLDLFDTLAFKLPTDTSEEQRSRAQTVGLATAVLTQGPGFVHAGSERLRSKSLDHNSYNSGDWFNAIEWDCREGNGFGRGLPPARDNQANWPYAAPLLADEALVPGCEAIRASSNRYEDLVEIKAEEPVFHLETLEQVQQRVSFPLSGTEETPGVITMRLDGSGLGRGAHTITVVFNASPDTVTQTVDELAGTRQNLHPAQAQGSDPVVKRSTFDRTTGTFTVPGRTVAVFVQR
ncbi:pullulanase-type alpha-1,6-glucosidase [Allostreptomyces psammosilenae]|uniref:1,4-alpha-D-glucan glucanohydrolase n=1 Tax=Allostreptomyces psammosilenae TaxID=1892865 RepID=A0A852ZXP9_9ACTN|nr:pullulanase-type alpha-1,6-glucosidase [Allostreptomyces psammosilenae]NYI07163.1 pullulanase-type alpha-1,6-glucosidase [Allostreptomyces psammosilenae]